jgi:hypothetical protein
MESKNLSKVVDLRKPRALPLPPPFFQPFVQPCFHSPAVLNILKKHKQSEVQQGDPSMCILAGEREIVRATVEWPTCSKAQRSDLGCSGRQCWHMVVMLSVQLSETQKKVHCNITRPTS